MFGIVSKQDHPEYELKTLKSQLLKDVQLKAKLIIVSKITLKSKFKV